MARKRTRSHVELREQFDAAERKKTEDETAEDEDEEEGDDDEEEEGDEEPAAADAEEGGADDDEDDDDEEKPKKKAKKPKKVVVKVVKPKRTRTPKVIRQKVVWAVFNNSNQRVATYDYRKKQDAHDHAARLQTEKKQTFFVQPVKEPIDEPKEPKEPKEKK